MTAGAVGGFVLAGGRSSRMGTDKALLRLQGETLLERAAQAVAFAAGSAVIVGDPLRYGAFRYPVIPDTIRDSGPLGGIEAALAFTDAEWNLIVACDMPGLSGVALAALVSEAGKTLDADVLIPDFDGSAQPLCALYHRRSLETIRQALRGDRRKIMDAIRPLRVIHVPVSDEEMFRNVNTPEDWSVCVSR